MITYYHTPVAEKQCTITVASDELVDTVKWQFIGLHFVWEEKDFQWSTNVGLFLAFSSGTHTLAQHSPFPAAAAVVKVKVALVLVGHAVTSTNERDLVGAHIPATGGDADGGAISGDADGGAISGDADKHE
ncbi:hypothetical protein ON010_g10928 [Phytophthora cinnamomi]|nr:hypothetical protein ON010_g10928 [Phytophthora cinnamomi]